MTTFIILFDLVLSFICGSVCCCCLRKQKNSGPKNSRNENNNSNNIIACGDQMYGKQRKYLKKKRSTKD